MDELSIWGMPDERSRIALRGIIERLSENYDSPRFEPHITILGGIRESERSALCQVQSLASVLSPYVAQFQEVRHFEDHFRAIVLEVNPTFEVFNANVQAWVRTSEQRRQYYPHVSLMYANLSAAQADHIVETLPLTSLPPSTRIESVQLWQTGPEIRRWRRLRNYALVDKDARSGL